MNFDPSEEQRALADTVRRFVERDYGFEARRAIRASAAGWSRETWDALAGLGVLAAAIDEAHGGLGYGPQETALVMAEFGRGLLLEPYLAAAVIAPELIRRAASADFQARWLPQIATGDAIVIVADADARGQAVTHADGRLHGAKAMVDHGACADLLLVTARAPGGDPRQPPALYAVAADAAGVARRDYPLLDGRRAADIDFDAAPATRVGAGDTAMPVDAALDAAFDIGLAAVCAEAVGIMEATLAATADYLRTRRQFGQPIGNFQALQHRMADMLLHLEQARSMSHLAAMRCRDENGDARRLALSAAKVTVGQACRFVAQNAVQLHGGMGMTDELVVSHWFKRLTAIELSFGDTDAHLQRFARLSRTPS